MNNIGIAGCGALGSHIATFIAEPDTEFLLFDFDTVDEQNVISGTSVYCINDIGLTKVRALSGILYGRFATKAIPIHGDITTKRGLGNLATCSLVIDSLDNVEARSATCLSNVPALHVGVSPQMIGAIEWDDTYELPALVDNPQPNEVCTHQLGRDLILLTAVVASTIIRRFLADGTKLTAVVNNKMEIIR